MHTPKSVFLALLISLLLIPACNKVAQKQEFEPVPPPPDRLVKILLNAAESEREEGAFQKADSLYQEALENGLELAEVHYQRACNFALWGKSEKGILALRESVALGFSDHKLLESSAALDSLRKTSDFAQILQECKMQVTPPLLVLPNSVEAKTPTIVFLHGWGGNHTELHGELKHWADAGWVAIAPRAPESLEDGGFRWVSDNTEQTKAYLDRVFQHPSLKELRRDNVFLAGFSQGASYSVRLSLAYPNEFRGAIAICPGAWEPKAKELEVLKTKPNPLFLVWGEKDHGKNVKTAKLLEEAWQKDSWPIRTLSHPEGHVFPPDWDDRRSEIADFLLLKQ